MQQRLTDIVLLPSHDFNDNLYVHNFLNYISSIYLPS